MNEAIHGFTVKDRVKIALAFLTVIPLVLVLFSGVGRDAPEIVALVTSVSIIAAGYSLAWGTESLQFIVSQVLALAFLAVVQVLPEYSIEAVLSYQGAFDPVILHYATASMTGANRLLLGVGWPSIVIISYLMSRKRGEKRSSTLVLDSNQSVSVFFLAISTAYSFIIIIKGTLTVIDAMILVLIYASYVYVARKLPPVSREELERVEGPVRAISNLSIWRRYFAIALLLVLGGFIIFTGSQPFVESILEIGRRFKIDEYLLIQWLAPFLTEFPEGVTAVYWATKSRLAPVAIANLVSSKVNQWTLLIGTIPVVYSVALASFQPIHLTNVQIEEILITAAQSLYGVTCMLDLKFDIKEGGLLLALFFVQFFVPPLRIEVTVAYFLLSAFEVIRIRKNVIVFSSMKEIIRS
jgi:cation:H+ antiporter